MISFEFDGRRFAMDFEHEHNSFDGEQRDTIGGTTCYIYGLSDARPNHVVGYGASYLHPGDTLNKALGRKISLMRALNAFPKPMRAAAWKAYHER
jgi:hypothetical protein